MLSGGRFIAARSSEWIETTGIRLERPSTCVRRVMLPVCQCSSCRPVMRTTGIRCPAVVGGDHLGRHEPGATRRSGKFSVNTIACRIAFLFARVGDGLRAPADPT